MASNGKRMVKEDLINYLEEVQTNYPDPSDIGGGGTDFTPTNGLEFTEVEGETYLGLTQATSDKIDGAISENSTVNGRLTFNSINATGDYIFPIALNHKTNTAAVKDTTGILFGFYSGDENYNYGKIQFNQINKQFTFGEMVNGDYATVSIPRASYLLENDWPTSRTIALGAKVGSTTVYAGNDGVIELPDSSVEKKLYLVTLYMTDLDSGVSFLSDNDFGLCENRQGYDVPSWDNDLYENGVIYSDLTSDQKTKIANIIMNIKPEPYDSKIGGMVQNTEGNTDIILSGTFAWHSDLILDFIHNNNGTLSLTQEVINIIDGNNALISQLTSTTNMKFSIIQIL